MKLIDLYLQHSPVGSGQRFFFVVKEGRKLAYLLYAPTLDLFPVGLAEIKRATVVEPTKKTATILKRALRDRPRFGFHVTKAAKAAAKRALAELKGAPLT